MHCSMLVFWLVLVKKCVRNKAATSNKEEKKKQNLLCLLYYACENAVDHMIEDDNIFHPHIDDNKHIFMNHSFLPEILHGSGGDIQSTCLYISRHSFLWRHIL